MDAAKNPGGCGGVPAVSIVLNLHSPYAGQVKHSQNGSAFSYLEQCFFEALSETYIPFLAMLDRLDRDRVPFRMGVSISPVLCQMLADEALIKKYLNYTEKQIEFSARELKTLNVDENLRSTVKYFSDQIIEKHILFTERYNGDLVKILDYYQQKGRLEILGIAATHAFLPFYAPFPEAVQAEIETALGIYRKCFGKYPQGFWLPEFGWTEGIDAWLRSYNFTYTMVDTHGLLLASPQAESGTFFPARTPSGVFLLGRDFYASEDIKTFLSDPVFRDNRKDLGFELSRERLGAFLEPGGSRSATGFKCWSGGGEIYDFGAALQTAEKYAAKFLKNRLSRLETAASRLNGAPPVSLCAFEAESFGRRWNEGFHFLETLYRLSANKEHSPDGGGIKPEPAVQFVNPADYLYRLDSRTFQVLTPEFSSSGENGYAEAWVDSSSCWMYCHTMRALERMVEIAERFPDDSGLKERVLNQAAREILLLLASDWPKMLYRQEYAECAKNQIESFLRNFTTIYEALGSNCISTEWLTMLEKVHNVFPNINYRIFRRKKKTV